MIQSESDDLNQNLFKYFFSLSIKLKLGNYVKSAKLINKNADKNAKNYFGKTPLHLAASKGQIHKSKLIFKRNKKRF